MYHKIKRKSEIPASQMNSRVNTEQCTEITRVPVRKSDDLTDSLIESLFAIPMASRMAI